MPIICGGCLHRSFLLVDCFGMCCRVFLLLCLGCSTSNVWSIQNTELRARLPCSIGQGHHAPYFDRLPLRGGSITNELDFSSMLDEIPVKMLHEMENSSTYPTKPLNQTFDVDEKLLKEEQERTQWEMESAFAEKEFSSDRYIDETESKLGALLTDSALPDSDGNEAEYSKLIDSVLNNARDDGKMETDDTPDPNIRIPGERYKTLKEAIMEIPKEGYNLILESIAHGPYMVVHDYPEEDDHNRTWPDAIYMQHACNIIGEQGAKVELTLSILCTTKRVGTCAIRGIDWFAHHASCLYIFAGEWEVEECSVRSDHPAGDAIYCRGVSRLPLARKRPKVPGTPVLPPRFVKFPRVKLKVVRSALGGVKAGVPTGWGVLVCEKASLVVMESIVEYCHQAISVVDWCRAEVLDCDLRHNGNALWFGNFCDVSLKRCKIWDTVSAFCLRTMWDRGTKCMAKDQDIDDGRNAKLSLESCEVDAPAFDGEKYPGTFRNFSSHFTIPVIPANASLVRPKIPTIEDPQTFHMRNLNRDRLDYIKTFGADPELVQENPDYKEQTSAFTRLHRHMAPAKEDVRCSGPVDFRS
mmetsp:Transcript_812/g.1745  ORF Transcript_812/g.1745 Transcript_812/m.1745 type:complete len:582 (-) Transcript_812:633-2378(-)